MAAAKPIEMTPNPRLPGNTTRVPLAFTPHQEERHDYAILRGTCEREWLDISTHYFTIRTNRALAQL